MYKYCNNIRIDHPTHNDCSPIIKDQFPNIFDANSDFICFDKDSQKDKNIFITKEKRDKLIEEILDELSNIPWE